MDGLRRGFDASIAVLIFERERLLICLDGSAILLGRILELAATGTACGLAVLRDG